MRCIYMAQQEGAGSYSKQKFILPSMNMQARYIDWFFTTPLLLLDILLIAGVSFGTTLW